MKPFEVVGLPPDELNSFLSATHPDPFRVLGPHRMGDDLVIRVFRPDAQKIDVRQRRQSSRAKDRQASEGVPAEKIHRDGFFCATVPNATRDLDYHIRITGHDGKEWLTRDPYRYGPIMGEIDLHLFLEGQHWEIYEKFGAHLRNIGGDDGVYFAVWAPNAQRVSVVGDFNHWDGRINPMRKLLSAGAEQFAHRIDAAIPMVEITDYADPLRVRRPDRKINAVVAADVSEMRAELFVDLPMLPFQKQMEIDLAHDRAVTVRIARQPFFSVKTGDTDVIIEIARRVRHSCAKKTVPMNFLRRHAFARLSILRSRRLSALHDIDLLRIGPKNTNDQIVAHAMRPQDAKRVGMGGGEKRVQLVRRQSHNFERLHGSLKR